MKNILILPLLLLFLLVPSISQATSNGRSAIFNVVERKQELQKKEFELARKACLATNIKLDSDIPQPIDGLKSTKGYGSDRRASKFAWFLMVHGGRALADNKESINKLKEAITMWARAGALLESDEAHDTYYALKRLMLPLIASYSIIADDMDSQDKIAVEAWIDVIVRKLDKKFGGDVDHNNHRYLADSVLAAWGVFINDDVLYNKGVERFKIALSQMDKNGVLSLETRRGSRALWYIRQSLADLTAIAESARIKNNNLYKKKENGKDINLLMNYYLDALRNPIMIMSDASENYISGPSRDFLKQDFQMLKTRPHGRHYMAFAEPYLRNNSNLFNSLRLRKLMEQTGFNERPMIDEYIGGNATCFWWKSEEGTQ